MTAQFQIQQCLHGYDDGHELLASSVKLSPRETYLLSQLSDLSGQNSPREISGYLTGYPLESAPYYVIACTWLAFELPRPGCAWTHSLLIENGDLSAIKYAQALMSLFRRPEVVNGRPNRQSYATPLIVDEDMFLASAGTSAGADNGADRVEAIVRGLYQTPEKKVFWVSQSDENHAETVLGIWSQQWPRLRRSFRFCSGSLQDRSDRNRKFDFQVLRQPRAVSSVLNDPEALVLDRSRPAVALDVGWVQDVVADIRNPAANALRRFLWRYGPDTRGARDSFQALAEVFHLLMQGDADSVLRAVGIYKSVSTEFEVFIKHMVEGYSEGSVFGIPPLAPFAVLRVLLYWGGDTFSLEVLSKLASSAISDVGFQCLYRVLLEVENARTAAWEYAAHAVITASFDAPQSDGAKIVETLVVRNSSLLGFGEIWKSTPDALEALLTRLDPVSLSSEVIRAASYAAFHAGQWKAVYYFLKQNAQAAVFGLLDAAEECGFGFDYRALCRLLEDYGEQATAWLRQRGSATPGPLAVILELTGYDHRIIDDLPARAWVPLAQAAKLWSPQVLTQSKSALLVTALSSSSWEDGGVLAQGSFEPVHHLLAHDDLPSRLWFDIRRCVPELGWRHNWDKAERLRHQVLNSFASKGWPIEKFFDVVTTAEAFGMMVSSKILTPAQAGVLRSVFEAINAGQLPAPSWLNP